MFNSMFNELKEVLERNNRFHEPFQTEAKVEQIIAIATAHSVSCQN